LAQGERQALPKGNDHKPIMPIIECYLLLYNQTIRDNFWLTYSPAHLLTPPSPHNASVFCMSVPFSRLNIQIRPRGQRGELGENEKWWAERQKALEQAGYMLRPRYRSDRKFSWAGTDRSYLEFEDGQPQVVSVVIY
jgi:hypothetical protein